MEKEIINTVKNAEAAFSHPYKQQILAFFHKAVIASAPPVLSWARNKIVFYHVGILDVFSEP